MSAAREYRPADLVHVPPRSLPPNLLIPRLYRPLVESMLQRSPTFARQCRRLEHALALTVTLELASTPSHVARLARARTQIVRDGGRLVATVAIAHTNDAVELIAHEIEHVIEQLDEVDLASKAHMPDSGVRAIQHERVVFETTRARRIGLRVAEEVRRHRPGITQTNW